MRQFTYVGSRRLRIGFLQVTGLLTITFCTVLAAWLGGATFAVNSQSAETLVCLSLWCLGVGWIAGLTFINAFPTIWMNDKGVLISIFVFGRVFIRWDNIVDLGAGHVPFGNILVRARRITPFHMIYGWLYSRTLFPSFIIDKGIEGYDQIEHEFRRRALLVTDS